MALTSLSLMAQSPRSTTCGGDMFTRCYSGRYQQTQPTYLECTVDSAFWKFQEFAGWLVEQHGYAEADWQLDKDLIVKGNKKYSPSTCVLLPRELNCILTRRQNHRGAYPVGVCWHKSKENFIATLSVGGKLTHLGVYDTAFAAYGDYKLAKEAQIRRVAQRYVGQLDSRAYSALMDYKVAIDD